jgi:hypothetical protein
MGPARVPYDHPNSLRVITMPLSDRYSVHIHDRSQVEYRDVDRTVILPAGMLDGEVYVGRQKVTAGTLDPADRDEITERVYHHLNVTRAMDLRFLNPDGSQWQPPPRPARTIPDAVDRVEPGLWPLLQRILARRRQ